MIFGDGARPESELLGLTGKRRLLLPRGLQAARGRAGGRPEASEG